MSCFAKNSFGSGRVDKKGHRCGQKKNDMRLHLGADYQLFAELLHRKGDKLQARETLVKAIEIYKWCGNSARAQQVEKLLSHT